MTFLFGVLDLALTAVLLLDTLGLAYQLRKTGSCDPKDYIRVCFSWILFLFLSGLLSCNLKGFFGTLLRIVFFAVKAYVTLPILGGTSKLYKFLIEDGNGQKYYEKVSKLVKTQLGKYCPNCASQCQSCPSTASNPSPETVTPQ